jgi:hypothetical protein
MLSSASLRILPRIVRSPETYAAHRKSAVCTDSVDATVNPNSRCRASVVLVLRHPPCVSSWQSQSGVRSTNTAIRLPKARLEAGSIILISKPDRYLPPRRLVHRSVVLRDRRGKDVLSRTARAEDRDDAAHVGPHRMRNSVCIDRQPVVVAEEQCLAVGAGREPPRVIRV